MRHNYSRRVTNLFCLAAECENRCKALLIFFFAFFFAGAAASSLIAAHIDERVTAAVVVCVLFIPGCLNVCVCVVGRPIWWYWC